MNKRALYAKECPCGQRFTTSDKDSVYHNKSCAAKFRVEREGMPLVWVKPNAIEALKNFRR